MNTPQLLNKSKLLILVLSTLTLKSCDTMNFQETRQEFSETLTENATISDVVYMPSNHSSETDMVPVFNSDGDFGVGISTTEVNLPAKYAVVFKCQHGKFIIEGTDAKYLELWEKFEEGMEVEVLYRKEFESIYKGDKNQDGEKDLISKEFIDYDFLDAQIKEPIDSLD